MVDKALEIEKASKRGIYNTLEVAVTKAVIQIDPIRCGIYPKFVADNTNRFPLDTR